MPRPSPPDRSSLRLAAFREPVCTNKITSDGPCSALALPGVFSASGGGGAPGLTCPGRAPSGGPGAARTQTPLTASENRWRRGGRGGPASHLSGWRSWSPRRPEVEETDITPLIVEQTPANNQLDGDKNLICLNCLALCCCFFNPLQ